MFIITRSRTKKMTSSAIVIQSIIRKKLGSCINLNKTHISDSECKHELEHECKHELEQQIKDLIKDHIKICTRHKQHAKNLKKLLKLVKKEFKKERDKEKKKERKKEKKKEKKARKKRKNADCQCTELLVCLYLLQILPVYDKQTIITNKQKILGDPRFRYNSITIEHYFNDLQEYGTNKEMTKYMLHIDTNIIDLDFKTIYLTGKKSMFSIINHLITSNKLNDRQKKGDVYLEYENNSFTSISVKKNFKCTLTNYPTERLAKQCGLFDIVKETKECRLNICKNYIPHFDSLSCKDKKIQYKLVRKEQINRILHNSNLDLWKNEERIINNSNVQQLIIESMFPDVSFQNVSYDGDAWKNIISYKNIQSYQFKRCITLDTTTSAKIWYIVYINKKLHYIMEIRGKNEIYGGGAIQAFVYYKKTRLKDIQTYKIPEQL